MSRLQKSFAKAKLASLPLEPPHPPGHAPGAEYGDQRERRESLEQADELKPLPETRRTSDQAVDDDAGSASSASSAGSAGTIRPEDRKGLLARPKRASQDLALSGYAPLPWTFYYEQDLRLSDPKSHFSHHVYLTPPTTPTAPLFVMHHGAGSSGLSFAACTAEMRNLAPEIGILSIDARGHGDTILLTRGGVPSDDEEPSLGALNAFEEHKMARKQGLHKDGVLDMSLEAFARDLEKILMLVADKMGWRELPNLILVGHSLGGAVVTHVAKEGRLGNRVLGYAVLDVVEGSAIDALQSMQTYLSNRPKTFPSVEAAIEWHLRSRTIRTATSARISVPALLREADPNATPPQSPSPFSKVTTFPNTHPNTFTSTPLSPPAPGSSSSSSDVAISSERKNSAPSALTTGTTTTTPGSSTGDGRRTTKPHSSSTSSSSSAPPAPPDHIIAQPPLSVDPHQTSPSNSSALSPASKTAAFLPLIHAPFAASIEPATAVRYTWRTDLRSTAPFWENWFKGLSSKFLSARGGKLLLLAGTDRLDKELMIGQMQGKYQLQVYPDAGHFLHEDQPQKTAAALIEFWKRNDGRLALPLKVQEKLKKRTVPQGVVQEAEKGLQRKSSVKSGNSGNSA